MNKHKRKTITELRSSLFETFEDVAGGETHLISHKNGRSVAMIPIEKLEALEEEVELHKNLAIGYAQAMRGEGISSEELLAEIKESLKKR
ncbi:MAG: type II toxin-antitoxin system Phd/YefM family antitoxin [Bacteriovoracaceae bacterium]|nr:type II toxin-antitoxin system Phd/YefM family antitoxin [Bacteriovoracaceae bacterium]